MNEKEKYLSIYQGELSEIYRKHDTRGRADGGYGRACWGEGILDSMARWKVQSLLDVGCGYGRFCDAASRFVPRVMGLDIASVTSGNVIDNPAVEFIDGEAKSLPLPDNAVEWITSFDCLEHCLEQDIDTVLTEFNRVATKGFVLSISYDPDHLAGVPLHMTVKPESWWIEKLSRYGEVTKEGHVPITGVPYLVVRKPVRKRLICYCVGGLANRLLPLASCWDLARRTDRELAILWRNDDFRCQAGFDELFLNHIPILSDDDFSRITSCKIYADPNVVAYEAELNKTHVLKDLTDLHGCNDQNQMKLDDAVRDVIIYHNNFLAGTDQTEALRFFQELKPVKALQDRIDALIGELGIDQTIVGVHARGTDFNVQVAEYAERIALQLRENPRRCLVCSDDEAYEQRLKSIFPNHVIIRPKQDCVRRGDPHAGWTNNTLTSNAAIKEGIVDIYLLARTDFKIFHPGSSFAMLVQLLKQALQQQVSTLAPSSAPVQQMPQELQSAYTMNGRIAVEQWYLNESGREGNLHYPRELIDRLIGMAQQRKSCNYGDTDQWLYQMLAQFPIAGQRVLVMGSQVPFYEAVCLAHGAYPTTVEFKKIQSGHPDLKTMTVAELEQTQELFDAAISISTFEHTGLGRYGDPLDPDGDLKAMQSLHAKIKNGGLLFLAVPMGKDTVVWNAHRIYGKHRLPQLIAGWDLLAAAGSHAESKTYGNLPYYQPIFVLKNTMGHLSSTRSTLMQHRPAFQNAGVAAMAQDNTGEALPPGLQGGSLSVNPAGHTGRRIMYFCPDVKLPSAGVRRVYRHVAILKSQGFNAFILHQNKGFKAPDQPDVPLAYLDQAASFTHNDIVVIPEGQPQIMHALRNHPCRKFVIALNWHYVFNTLLDQWDWRKFKIERVMVVSPFIGQMVSWAMRLPIHLLDSSVDASLYRYMPEQKTRQVAYIKQKAKCIDPFMRLLAARNPDYTHRIQWRALADLPEGVYAQEICKSSVFLNLSLAEGFPTSCMEAMAAGTLVVGFDGVGGRDLLKHNENCKLAPNGDYVSLAYAISPLLDNMLNGGTKSWDIMREHGFKTVAPLTAQKETQSVVEFWQTVL